MIHVILATKNGSKYIERAIQSVLTQTENHLEMIVVDDASTDSTAEIVKKMAILDPRIRLVSLTKNVGPGKARDAGIKAITLESSIPKENIYIALIDDDDVWLQSNKLERQKSFLDTHTEHALVGSAKIFNVDERGLPYPDEKNSAYMTPHFDHEIRSEMLRRNCFVTSSVMFRKKAYDAVGGFKPMHLAEEYDLWLRMGRVGWMTNLDGIEVNYTFRHGSVSRLKQREMYTTVLSLVKEYKNQYPKKWLGLAKAYARILLFDIKQLL